MSGWPDDWTATVSGARVRDEITGKEWKIRAKCVINPKGPFTDSIREMDQQAHQGESISGDLMHEIVREVDVILNKGLIELDEFLQLMAHIKSGCVTNSHYDQLEQEEQENAEEEESNWKTIPVESKKEAI
ncbi:hypothetical protein DAPPUDRAFT_117034 [Daphnia pulex]|uniref:glycerol-3-phosphate dehydrogenase n=1 Tax=Daphnia pulex TaxID=6669 RepID=E9HRB0_DAPPU|nr:hypothetical protein DAPPUDRAFT_117034 [Daphnia pulex]|eukprot:EFX65729.1 hypothetical protein DAPPUDRAFT_117034 [Daphnia pulex]